MDYETFTDKYKDLIYVPLALSVPRVDLDKFRTWLDNNKLTGYTLRNFSLTKAGKSESIKDISESDYLEIHAKTFWKAVFAKSRESVENTETGWNGNFDKEFPEIVEFVEKFPLKNVGTVGFLFQNGESADEHVTSIIHIDEMENIGFRFYLTNTETGNTFFHKVKEEYRGSTKLTDSSLFLKRKDTPVVTAPALDWYNLNFDVDNNGEYIVDEEYIHKDRIYGKLPVDNPACAFVMTNESAIHGASYNNDNKITCLIISLNKPHERMDWDKADKLLEESLEKYGDLALWY